MTLTTSVRDKLAEAFAPELAAGSGSHILCDGEDAGFVDLNIRPSANGDGRRWELSVVLEIWDRSVKVNGVGAYALATDGEGKFDYVGTVGEQDGEGLPPGIVALGKDIAARVSALNLPLIALAGREAEMFGDLHRIISARNAGDDAALDDAILAAAERLSRILPHLSDELACEPAPGRTP